MVSRTNGVWTQSFRLQGILGDARNPEMQKLNLKIKYREGFRPFAPSVLAESRQDYFELKEESPYMLLVAPVKEAIANRFLFKDLGKDFILKEVMCNQLHI